MLKVKVRKISNAPQHYGYSVYVPNPNADNGTFADLCARNGYKGILQLSDLPLVKSNYLHLANGQLYGARDIVLNHIMRSHLVPPGGVVRLVSITSDENTTWINDSYGIFRVENFLED